MQASPSIEESLDQVQRKIPHRFYRSASGQHRINRHIISSFLTTPDPSSCLDLMKKARGDYMMNGKIKKLIIPNGKSDAKKREKKENLFSL